MFGAEAFAGSVTNHFVWFVMVFARFCNPAMGIVKTWQYRMCLKATLVFYIFTSVIMNYAGSNIDNLWLTIKSPNRTTTPQKVHVLNCKLGGRSHESNTLRHGMLPLFLQHLTTSDCFQLSCCSVPSFYESCQYIFIPASYSTYSDLPVHKCK